MTTQEQVDPAFNEGEAVYYHHSTDRGVVVKVIPTISYRYEVKWEDGDPNDIYSAKVLSTQPLT